MTDPHALAELRRMNTLLEGILQRLTPPRVSSDGFYDFIRRCQPRPLTPHETLVDFVRAGRVDAYGHPPLSYSLALDRPPSTAGVWANASRAAQEGRPADLSERTGR